MADQFNVTFKDFKFIDFSSAVRTTQPKGKPSSSTEHAVIKTALEGVSLVSSAKISGRISELMTLLNPPCPLMNIAGSIPGFTMPASRDFTISFGLGASAGAVVAIGGGGGVYYWNKPPLGQLGLYGSLSVGVITNVCAGFGDFVAYLFGPAGDVLAGDSITISVDIGVGLVTLSGLLILDAPPTTLWPPAIGKGWTPKVIGVGFGISVGMSMLPHDISVMPGRTWIKPVTP